MAISSNKLVPVLVVVAAGMVGYVAWTRMHGGDAKVAPGAALGAVPVPEGAEGGGTSLFGGALPNTRPGDIDTSAETLANVVASNKELRDESARAVEALNVAIKENAGLKVNEEAILQRVRAQLLVEMASKQPTAAGIPELVPQPQPGAPTNVATNPAAAGGSLSGLIENGIGAATNIMDGMGGQRQGGQAPRGQQTSAAVPGGLGYDGSGTPSGMGGAPSTALTRIVVPMGYAQPTGDQGGPLVRRSLVPVRTDAPSIGQPPFQLPGSQNGMLTAGADGTFSPGSAAANLGKPDQLEPWYTIPENATLGRATAMTTIVGRVPVDGRVTDPMQFKLIVGRDNLAANGQRIPPEITGAIVSGLAVGDMGLSCVEGLIQSITFIFQDGTIRTISQRNNGATPGLSSGGGGGNGQGSGVGGQSLAATSKLGWLSDGYGNPCIPGKFVTNAPRYLADVMGAKALSVAGAAIAAAETTTSSSTSANGSSESSTVTGNKGRYVMGKMASAGSEEVVNWLMRRLNNSFDAVVVPAGTKVAVHVDRELAIDRDPDGRRLDNSRSQAQLTQQRGTRHGAD